MNTYFSTSGKFYKEHKDVYQKIISLLEKYTGSKPYVAMGGVDYENSTDKDIINAVKDMEKKLQSTELVVTENTYSVAGVGYDVAKGMSNRKPTLMLVLKEEHKAGPHTLNTLKNKYFDYVSYRPEDLEEIVKNFVAKAKEKLDTKFILIISPEIDKYLQWASDQKRMHKAQIVRNAVEKQMDNDDEWKETANNTES